MEQVPNILKHNVSRYGCENTNNTTVGISSLITSSSGLNLLNGETELTPTESLFMTQESACRVYDSLAKLARRLELLERHILNGNIDESELGLESGLNIRIGDEFVMSVVAKPNSNTVLREVPPDDGFEQASFIITIRQFFDKNERRRGVDKQIEVSLNRKYDRNNEGWSGKRYSLSMLCDPMFIAAFNTAISGNVSTKDSAEYIGTILRSPFILLEELMQTIHEDFEFTIPEDFRKKIMNDLNKTLSRSKSSEADSSETRRRESSRLKAVTQLMEEMDLEKYPYKKYDLFIRINMITLQFLLPVFPDELVSMSKKKFNISDPSIREMKSDLSSCLEFLCGIYSWVPTRNKVWNHSHERACGVTVKIDPPLSQLSNQDGEINESKGNLYSRKLTLEKKDGTNRLYTLELSIPKRKELISDAVFSEHFKTEAERYKLRLAFNTCLLARLTIHSKALYKDSNIDSLFSFQELIRSDDLIQESRARRLKQTKEEQEAHPDSIIMFVSKCLKKVLKESSLDYWLSSAWVWAVKDEKKEDRKKRFESFDLTEAEQKILGKYFDQKSITPLYGAFANAGLLTEEDLKLLRTPTKKNASGKWSLSPAMIEKKQELQKRIEVRVQSIQDKCGINIRFDRLFHIETYKNMAKASLEAGDAESFNQISALESYYTNKVHNRVSKMQTMVLKIFPGGSSLGRFLSLTVGATDHKQILGSTGSTEHPLSLSLKGFLSCVKTGSSSLRKLRSLAKAAKLS